MKTLLIVSVIGGLALAYMADKHDANVCAAKGGHIVDNTTVGTGIGTNGQVSIVPVTTSFCLSADGRILE